jgi:tRNA-specific 2-thiouridylase
MLSTMVPEALATGARVLCAMSGGVDSAVAAARLREAGLETIGVTLHLWDYPARTTATTRCCAPEDAHDARLVADFLGIPHYTFDRREIFAAEVVAPFVDAYVGGKTPSPCVDCNRTVKMRELFGLADRLGATAIATGHYARVRRDPHGRARLYAARDKRKDQSYFLHMLTSDELARLVLPLGDSTKEEVRSEAIRRGLPGAEKGESQELCFVPDGDYATFVEQRADGRLRPGPIVDERGRAVGRHDGVHRFTVGQRRGLGVALGKPAFVTGIDADQGAVRIGDEAAAREAMLVEADWADDVEFPLRADVKVRSQHQPAPATIEQLDRAGNWRVRFDDPVRAIAPGQIAVAYDGDRVLGGARIARSVE